MTGAEADETLDCGARADDLLAQVADGRGEQRDEHQRTCSLCQARLRRYQATWGRVVRLRDVAVAPPPDFASRVMARVGRETEDVLTLDSAGGGVTSVALGVVEVLAAIAAYQVPGVVAVPDVQLRDDPPRLVVELVATLARTLPEVAADVRDAVLLHGRTVGGSVPDVIDVVVVDVRVG